MRGRWRTKHPSPPNPANQTTGATRAEGRGRSTRRGKRSAHANGGRQTAETAGTQGRAPRAQPTATNGSRARERGPLPPLKLPPGCDPKGSTKGGRGERPAGAAGEGGHAPAKPSAQPRPTANQTPKQPPATAPGGAPRARNRTRKPDDSPPRGRNTERGQRPSRPGRRRRDGQRARKPPHPAPRHSTARTTPADGETAARRTATAQAGRKQDARAKPPPRRQRKKKPDRTPQHARDRRGGRFPRRPRAAARTHAGRGHLARTRRRPASRERNGPTPNRRAGAR